MRLSCVLVSVVLVIVPFLSSNAAADSNDLEGGVLIAHHPTEFQYSPGLDWCEKYDELYSISNCEEQNPRVDLDGNLGESSVWYVLAAWDSTKHCCGISFGLGSYESSAYYFQDWQPCLSGALEIQDSGWPGPDTGTAIAASLDSHRAARS